MRDTDALERIAMDAIVVVGASAGGIEALRTMVRGLPADFAAPVCIVQHLGHHASELAHVLGKVTPLQVLWAYDGPLRGGTIYVAPPDRHLIVTRDAMELTHGPRENFARPAVDPLFRSAAAAFGGGAIGVVLTGRLGDGAAGMYEIKRRGGVAIVQDPLEAEYPDMPRNVMAHVEVDHCVPLAHIPVVLTQLVAGAGARHGETVQENAMAAQTRLGTVAAFTCPECGGSMQHEQLGTLGVYTCHIGHKLTTESLVYAQRSKLEHSAESLVRELHEHAAMCRSIAADATDAAMSRHWSNVAEETDQRLEIVRATFDGPWQM